MPKERILGLVDAENLYYTPKQRWGIKAKVDFAKLHRRITGGRRDATVIAYVVADPLVDQNRFLDRLIRIGYTPRIKILYSAKGRYHNSNWDDEIIQDGIEKLSETDRLVLVSGDGDFSGLVTVYKEQGKKISILCFEDDFSPQLRIADTVSFLDQTILMGASYNSHLSPPMSECRFPMRHCLFGSGAL